MATEARRSNFRQLLQQDVEAASPGTCHALVEIVRATLDIDLDLRPTAKEALAALKNLTAANAGAKAIPEAGWTVVDKGSPPHSIQ